MKDERQMELFTDEEMYPWIAIKRKDDSVMITHGNPKGKGYHCAFDIGCDFELAKRICELLNKDDLKK